MSLSTLIDLVESFNAPLIAVEADRCLNNRHPEAGCSRCVQVCPVEAITLEGRAVALDPAVCARCGACLWACPGGVFQQILPPEGKLLATLHQRQPTAAELTCPAGHETAGNIANALPVTAPRCLAALSPAMLISAAEAVPTLWLNDLPCAECPLGAVHATLRQAVERANAWLALYERAGRVHLNSVEHPPQATTRTPPIDGTRPAVDRRAFLRGQVRTSTITDVGARSLHTPNPISDRMQHWIPQERNRLLTLESRWPAPPNQMIAPDVIGLAAIEIDEAQCSLCGWCAGFCPTAALEWRAKEDRLQITFRPLRCIDCNVCMAACPTEAVHKRDAIPLAALRHKILLAEDTAAECQRCKKPTAARSGELCVWCAREDATSRKLNENILGFLKE
ncbi:MAG: hypothetical protein Kow0077_25550 [Anaerolineae bacterium]